MTLGVRYHPDALAGLRADVTWYGECVAGLGDRFEAAVERAVDGVVAWPESGTVWPGWDSIPVVRSQRVMGFPFRMVYLVQSVDLVVIAFAHDKRQPGYWRERAR